MTLGSETVEFTIQNTLRCHSSPVNGLAVSPDCSRLISIGDDSRVVLWSVASGEKLFEVQRAFNGPATAVSWASQDTSRFVVGFASGDIHLFWNSKGKSYRDHIGVSGGGGAVEDIVYDPVHDRVACISERSMQLWKIKGTELVPILPSPLASDGYGKCVRFSDSGASVVMFYLDTHECVCYSIEPWEKRWSKRLNSRIGYASLNKDGKFLMISNLKDSVDEYQFPSLEKVQSFKHPIATNCILQTKPLPSWNLVVTGGDNGFARVFNRISGQLVSEIRHGARGHLVQVVEAFVDPGGRCVVVTASSGEAPHELKIWLCEPPKVSMSSKQLSTPLLRPGSSLSTWWDRFTIAFIVFFYLLLFFFALAGLAFFVLHWKGGYLWYTLRYHLGLY